MTRFGDALREARKAKRLTLRTLSESVGKSIGYLSDIEHNRRRPPKKAIVKQIEEMLDVTNGHLCELAENERRAMPTTMVRKIMNRPRLSEVLLRADSDLSDSDFQELVEQIEDLIKNRVHSV